jgi:hypothetical protein
MEVSAKTGHNIKEFFREMSFVIAGGKKVKEEFVQKQQPTNPANNQPIKSSAGTVSLNAAGKSNT